MSYIRILKVRPLMQVIRKVYEKDTEERAWQYWLSLDHEAKRKNSWEKFLASIKSSTPIHHIDNRTDEEIIADSQNILKMKPS